MKIALGGKIVNFQYDAQTATHTNLYLAHLWLSYQMQYSTYK